MLFIVVSWFRFEVQPETSVSEDRERSPNSSQNLDQEPSTVGNPTFVRLETSTTLLQAGKGKKSRRAAN